MHIKTSFNQMPDLLVLKTLLALPDSYMVIVESGVTLDDILSHGKDASLL